MALFTGVLEQAVMNAAKEKPAVLKKSLRFHSMDVVSKSLGPTIASTVESVSLVIQYLFSLDIQFLF